MPLYDEDDEEFLEVDAAPPVSFTDLLAEVAPEPTLTEFFEQLPPGGAALTADDHVAIVDEIRERRGPLPDDECHKSTANGTLLPPPLPQTAAALPPPSPPAYEDEAFDSTENQTLVRGSATPGQGISICHQCGTERWYGEGECSTCIRAESVFTPQPDLPPQAVAVLIEDDDEPGFASAVADALERLAPHSGQALASHQIPPPEHDDPASTVTGWVMLAGRNAGKTYAGARWLDRFMRERPKLRARIIAPSFGDAVASCIEGPSGILAASNYSVQWKPAHPGGAQLVWPNGSVCYVIGTPTPRDVDRLRAIGNVDADWYEEAAANPQIEEAERQARLSRRRKGAKWIATTTPRPIKTIRDWKKDPAIAVSAATAHDNKHADPVWLEELERMYAGTRLYAQEVEGKVLEDVEGALWKLGDLERSRIADLVAFHESLDARGASITQAAVGVDPANSTGTTGIVLSVITDDRHLYVLEDASEPGRSSEQWARAAVNLARLWDAVIVPENDSGGDAIRGVLKAADLMDDITIVPATARGRGGKAARAEPIALLWERDDFRGHLIGTMPKLEDQLTSYVEGITKESPDRMDAMVWGCTFLWARASFNDVTTQFPSHMQAPGRASSRRPGAMIRWHTGQKARK